MATEAIGRVFFAKRNLDATKNRIWIPQTASDLTALSMALATARTAEDKAVADLQRHMNTTVQSALFIVMGRLQAPLPAHARRQGLRPENAAAIL